MNFANAHPLRCGLILLPFFGLLMPSMGISADAPPPRHHVVDHSDDPAQAFSNNPAYKVVDWDNVPNIGLEAFSNPPGGWALTPDGIPRQKVNEDIALKAHDAKLNQRPEQIFIARQAPYAFVTYSREGNPAAVRVELVSLAGGISTGSFLLTPNSKVEDVSPDGTRLLVHGEDQRGRLEIWTVDPQRTGAARTLITFPYNGDDTGKDVDWAQFTDSGHVAILNFGSKLAVFETLNAKVAWMAKVEGGYRPKISPGGKYALIRTRDAAYKYREPTVIECATGKPIGMLDPGGVADDPPLSFHSVAAWTPSGASVAMLDDHNARVWDMTHGKPSDLFGLPIGSKVWGGPAFAFTSETDALLAVDGETLIDFKRRVPLWQYEPLHDSIARVAGDGRCWYTLWDSEIKQYFLIGAELPDATAAARAAQLDPASLLLLHPGAKVSIKLDVQGTDEIEKHIQELLVKKLAERNISVADGQDVVVKAVVEVGQPQHAVYVRQGRPPQEGRHVTYTMKTSKIVVEFGGNVAWQTFRFDAPGNRVDLQPGESIERAIARVSRPDFAFFDRAEIPAYVARPHTPMCYGNSKLTPTAAGPSPTAQPPSVASASGSSPEKIPTPVPRPAEVPPAPTPPVTPPKPKVASPPVAPPPAPVPPVIPSAPTQPALGAGVNILGKMTLEHVNGNPQKGDTVQLSSGRLKSPEEVTVPLRLDVEAKTDSTNIRIGYARGELIFNWEMRPTELRHQDPARFHITGIKGKGSIPINEFVHITWIITPESSRVLVNGEERALVMGNYKDLHGFVTIYPSHGATIEVKSVSISPEAK